MKARVPVRTARLLRAIAGARWLPIVLVIAGVSASILLWRALVGLERNQLAIVGEQQARIAAGELGRGFQSVTRLFISVTERYGAKFRDRGWDVTITGLQATAWAEPSGKVRRVVPAGGSHDLAGADLAARDADRPAFLKVRESGRPAVTGSLALLESGPGFHLIVPMPEGARAQGVLLGVFSERVIEQAVLARELAAGWTVAVYAGDDELHRRGPRVPGRWAAESTFKIVDAERRLRVWPGPEVIARLHGPLPPLVLATGSVISLLLGASVGLAQAARRRAREAEAAYAAFRRSQAREARFAGLAQSGVIGMLVTDQLGNLSDANQAFLQMVGYSSEELLSDKARQADLTPPEWRAADAQAIEQLAREGIVRPWEKEYLRKDGTRVPAIVGMAMIEPPSSVAFVLDISERKQAERAVRESEELRLRSLELETQHRQAQEANRLKSEFLANMSHELRTPLNAVIGFAELMHDGKVGPVSEKHKEFLGDILTSSRHLLQLINDVLDLAKVESGRMDFHPQSIDLAKLVGEVRDILRTLAAQKRIRIQTEIDPGLGSLFLDPGKLKQVLYNYLSNALKFTPEEGRIDIRARPEGENSFRIEVEDSGIGIRAADLGRLFTEFQQLDAGAAKKYAGTGLGLALCKRMVEAQGGLVGVRSTLGVGSVFFAVLPRAARPAPAAGVSTHQRAPRAGRPTILVIEDDAKDRSWLARTLAEAGYNVETAGTGGEAIERCQTAVYDAITLDLLLPDMSGWDVLRALRNGGSNRDAPVIAVSVVAEKIAAEFALHDFLTKPADAASLVESLKRAGVGPGQSRPVLVVDDDPAALKLMRAALEPLGYRCVCASGGEEALLAAAKEPPAVVILDLLMPGMNGFEFLNRFRRTPEGRRAPVIVWTVAQLSAEDLERLEASAQGVVLKGPEGTATLLAELERYVPRLDQAQK